MTYSGEISKVANDFKKNLDALFNNFLVNNGMNDIKKCL